MPIVPITILTILCGLIGVANAVVKALDLCLDVCTCAGAGFR